MNKMHREIEEGGSWPFPGGTHRIFHRGVGLAGRRESESECLPDSFLNLPQASRLLPRHAGSKTRGLLKGKEPLSSDRGVIWNVFLSEKFLGCRFLSLSFDVQVESEIHSEGDKDDAIHDADDPQGI